MDLGTTITGLVIIGICILPYLVLKIKSKRRDKVLLQWLEKFALQHQSLIYQHDIWGNSAIGISADGAYVFAIRNANGTTKTHIIHLHDIYFCRIVNANSAQSSFITTTKLELQFTHRDANKPDTFIEIYNAVYDGLTLTGELQLIDKWHQLINHRIGLNSK